MFCLALKTQEKDETSSSLKHPRQSTKEVSVTEFSFILCKGVFNKTYPRKDEKYPKLRNSSHQCS